MRLSTALTADEYAEIHASGLAILFDNSSIEAPEIMPFPTMILFNAN